MFVKAKYYQIYAFSGQCIQYIGFVYNPILLYVIIRIQEVKECGFRLIKIHGFK